jgi:hypothetical protein
MSKGRKEHRDHGPSAGQSKAIERAKRDFEAPPPAAPEAETHVGRPPGAATIERPVAEAVPARCTRCEGTKHRVQRGAGPLVRQIAGRSRLTGEPYRYVVWRNVVCECGQHFRVREETMHDPRQ